MQPVGKRLRGLVSRPSDLTSLVPGPVARFLFVTAVPATCCYFSWVQPMVTMNRLKPLVGRVCARAVVGQPVADIEGYARRLGLTVYGYAIDPRGARRIYLAAERNRVHWYCVIESVDGVVRSKRTFGHLPGD